MRQRGGKKDGDREEKERLSGTGAQGVLLGEASVEELCRVRELPLSAVLVIIWVRTLPGPSTGGVGGLSPE